MNLGELSADFVLPLLKAAKLHDHDPSGVLTRFDLAEEELQKPGQWLSIPRFMRLGEALIELTGNPALGLEAGYLSGITGLGLAGMTALCARDLGTALQTLAEFEPLYARNIRGNISWHPEIDEPRIQLYSLAPYNEFNRFVVDSVLMGWVSLCQQLTGCTGLVCKVHIEFPAPDYMEAYVRTLPCEVFFGQYENGVYLNKGAIEAPLLFSSEPDFQRLKALCTEQLASLEKPLTLAHRTARAIASQLPKHCTLETTATQLKMPHWTLRRKLQEEDTTFKEIFETTRKDLACASLQHSPLPVAEIAYLTGFSSTEAFQRAFKRWTGLPPGEYRRQSQHF